MAAPMSRACSRRIFERYQPATRPKAAGDRGQCRFKIHEAERRADERAQPDTVCEDRRIDEHRLSIDAQRVNDRQGETGLAGTAGPDEGDHPVPTDAVDEARKERGSPDQGLEGVASGPVGRRSRDRRVAADEGGVLDEDSMLQVPEPWTGFDPVLVGEIPMCPQVGVERVGLAPIVEIEREHQECPKPLPLRTLGGPAAEVGSDLAWPVGPEACLKQLLGDLTSEFLQPCGFVSREGRSSEIRQRWAAPRTQRRREPIHSLVILAV